METEQTLLGVGSELSDGSSSGPDLRVVNDVELLQKGKGGGRGEEANTNHEVSKPTSKVPTSEENDKLSEGPLGKCFVR